MGYAMNPWTQKKPTKPGRYQVRNSYNNVFDVFVRRKGRGMVVYVFHLNDTIRMSDIDKDEIEWRDTWNHTIV
jgi:hypothetical protein